VLYTDHGSDFTSQHLEQVSADLRMQLIFSLAGQPRGRGRVERFFATANDMFLCELDGYAPPRGSMRGKPRLTLTEFDGRFRTFLFDVYHRCVGAETKMPPAERWESGGFLPRMPESLEELDLLLIQVAKMRKVRPDGIRFATFRYVSTTLAAYVGESVTIRYDPRDLAEIRIFYKGKFLCRAICPDLAGTTVPLRDIMRARRQRRSALRTILRDHRQTAETLLGLKRGEPTEVPDAIDPAGESPSRTPAPTLKRYRNE